MSWHCPNCATSVHVRTSEGKDDDARGVQCDGHLAWAVRCPMCETWMVEEGLIAARVAEWKEPGVAFAVTDEDVDRWRAEIPKSAHADDCCVYDPRGVQTMEFPCNCGHDERMR